MIKDAETFASELLEVYGNNSKKFKEIESSTSDFPEVYGNYSEYYILNIIYIFLVFQKFTKSPNCSKPRVQLLIFQRCIKVIISNEIKTYVWSFRSLQ